VLERAVRTCGADSDAAAVFDLADLNYELAMEYQALGRWEDALAAVDAAVDAGLQTHPDPRCLRAESLMRAGRVADARAEYAAHLAANADPGVIAWPPGRNQPCWCGSGRKYKKCCAAPTLVDTEPHR
jgi:uncharacterized protein YecA (UPF0149 family)